MRGLYYDREGRPMETLEWARAFQGERHIGLTKLQWGGEVSTVWLGMDHGFGAGPPLIFETMVFSAGNRADLDCKRYATEPEARAGHEEMVAKWFNAPAERRATEPKP